MTALVAAEVAEVAAEVAVEAEVAAASSVEAEASSRRKGEASSRELTLSMGGRTRSCSGRPNPNPDPNPNPNPNPDPDPDPNPNPNPHLEYGREDHVLFGSEDVRPLPAPLGKYGRFLERLDRAACKGAALIVGHHQQVVRALGPVKVRPRRLYIVEHLAHEAEAAT